MATDREVWKRTAGQSKTHKDL